MIEAGLLGCLDAERGLASIPCIVANPEPSIGTSVPTEAGDVVVALRYLLRECRELAQLLWRRFWSMKWWLLLMLGVAGFVSVLVFLGPSLN